MLSFACLAWRPILGQAYQAIILPMHVVTFPAGLHRLRRGDCNGHADPASRIRAMSAKNIPQFD